MTTWYVMVQTVIENIAVMAWYVMIQIVSRNVTVTILCVMVQTFGQTHDCDDTRINR